MSEQQPVVFLSHGAGPSYYIDANVVPHFKGMDKDSQAAEFFRHFPRTINLKRPSSILVISAHWEESVCTVNTNSKHSLYYDYSNFPPETYKLTWPVVGAPEVGRKIKSLLEQKGIQCKEDSKRGLDHGVFVPLKLAFPEADVPVCQLSLLMNMSIHDHLVIAETLSDLSQENILIIGSGFATHSTTTDDPEYILPEWATSFRQWLNDVFTNTDYTVEERRNKILTCLETAPGIMEAHPTIEHLMPLLMSCAVAGYRPGKLLHSEFIRQSLLNEHYIFPMK